MQQIDQVSLLPLLEEEREIVLAFLEHHANSLRSKLSVSALQAIQVFLSRFADEVRYELLSCLYHFVFALKNI
jgi:hypothetical protein